MSGAPHRGGQRVGLLEDLGDVERLAVRWLRSWGRDPVGIAHLETTLTVGLGPDQARNIKGVFEDLMEVGRQYGRRALCRHGCHCRCLGADEAVFAHLIEAGASGDQEDAALLASLVVRPDMAMCFAGLAAEFGMALHKVARAAPARPQISTPVSATVH